MQMFDPTTLTLAGEYRYGFSGQEKDDEVKGSGNSYNYTYRIYDPRVSRFLSVDPLSSNFPWYTPYQYAGNKPIYAIDLDGLEEVDYSTQLARMTLGHSVLQKDTEWLVQHRTNITQGNSFWRASIMNTLRHNPGLYENIAQRNAFYAFSNQYLAWRNINVVWFGAAEIVTGRNAVGGVDRFGSSLLTSSDARDFLRQGNAFLLTHNMRSFNALMHGQTPAGMEGLSGRALDYAMVEFEQGLVTEFIDYYFTNNPNADKNKIMGQINSLMSSFFADDNVKSVINEHFTDTDGNVFFDFGNEEHRVTLGQRLIDRIDDGGQ